MSRCSRGQMRGLVTRVMSFLIGGSRPALVLGVCAIHACAPPGYYGPPPEPYAPPSIGAQIVSNGGACVGSEGGSDADGTPAILFHCDGMPGQHWTVKGGHIARASGSCLDVQGSAATEGAQIILVQCYG